MGEPSEAHLGEIEAVYRRRYGQFLHVASAITDDVELGADAVQEAFARAIRLRSGYRASGSLEGWLWRIVVNSARDHAAGRELSGVYHGDQLLGEPNALDPSGVRGALAGLPERQRIVLFLRYFADLDYDSIAGALGISSGTVGATLHKAHAALRSQMEEVHRP